jgi:hypothetical protein
MLNLRPVRLRWRESVSLHRFQNRNLLKLDHFRWHGVEDQLDTTPTFQPNLLRRKRREGVANRNHGWPQPAAQTQNPDPVGISLLRAKNGLDNGVHFNQRVQEAQMGMGLL